MKKKLEFTIILLFFGMVLFGQNATVSIDDYTENPGAVDIPIDVTNFNDVGAITLYLQYDQNVLTYSSFTTTNAGSFFVTTYPFNGMYMLAVSWAEVNPLNIAAGELMTLEFNYLGGESDFAWQTSNCEIATLQGVIVPTNYTDGSIGPISAVPIIIEEKTNQLPGTTVQVAMDVDFSGVTTGVGSFNFEIEYDESILTFQQITNTSLTGITVNLLSSPSRIALAWTATGSGSLLNGKLLDLEFYYIGGYSDLAFLTAACEVANYNAEVQNVNYIDGLVSQDPATMTNIIIDSIGAEAGTEILLPVTVKNFQNMGAFDFVMEFEPIALEFVELTNVNASISAGLLYNDITGILSIAWTAGSSGVTLTDDEKLFDLKFNYFGTDTEVNFQQQSCSMSDFNAETINGYYVDGKVTEIVGNNATVSMDTLVSPLQSNINVPVEVTGFNNIGAITLEVTFNPALIVYVDVENIHTELTDHGSVIYNNTGGVFTFSWSVDPFYGQGIDVADNASIFDIKFYYQTGVADLVFNTSNCDISDYDAEPLNVYYSDGQVSGGVTVDVKAFLQGPYNQGTGLMNTSINDNGNLPLSHPYGGAPWSYTGTEAVTTMPTNVVDWVLLEVRSGISETTTIERKAALLLEDGTIVQYDDPANGVVFDNVIAGNSYYIVVWHRNHIPVMSGSPVVLPNTGTPYDFTEIVLTTPYLHNSPTPAELEIGGTGSGIYGMIAGDVNADGQIKYSGFNNDKDPIALQINVLTGSTFLYLTANGYYPEDINMDNVIKFSGFNNDPDILTNNLFLLTGNVFLFSVYSSVVPGAIVTK